MMKRHLVFLLCLVGAGTASAQRPLTLEECLQIARTNSIALRLNENNVQATRLAKSENQTTGLPQVKLASNASIAPQNGISGYDPAITEGGQIAGQIVVQESLFDAGVRGLKSDQLDLELDRLSYEGRAADRDLVFTITTLFIESLVAQRAADLQRQNLQQLADYLDLVQQLLRGGNASETDVLKTQVQLNSARIALYKAVQDNALARASLAEAMGIPGDTAFVTTGSLGVPDSLSSVPLVPDSLPANLELQMGQLEVRKSLVDVEISRREQWPTLSLTGDAGYLSSVNNLKLPSAERLTPLGYSVGVALELPLFTWGGIGLRIEQRQVAAEAEALRLSQTSRVLRAELRSLRLQMETVLATLRSLQGTMKTAEDNFVLTKAKFAGGGTLSLEVLTAFQLLSDSRMAELQAQAQWHSLQAKLAQLTAH